MKTKTRQISHAAILRQLSNPREMARLNALCCEDSFFEFVRQFWHVNSSVIPVWNWHIKYLCREIQTVAERVFRDEPKEYDLIINVPPGSTKSTIASIMLPAWAWARMPSCQVICASYVASLSLKLSRQCRNIIRSPLYQRYWPHLAISRDNDTKTEFSNTMGGFRYACGIGGSVTGNHGHIQIVDDPLDPKGAASIPCIDTANSFMNETLYNRKIRMDLTPLILIMQRLHQNDPTGMILSQDQKDIKHICLPAEITDGQQVFPPELVRHYKDGLFDPVRLSMKELEKAKKKLGPYSYAGQYDQMPIPRSGGTFQTDRIGVDATGHYYSSLLEGTKIEVEQKWQEFDLLTPPEEITVWPAFRGDYLTFIPATIVNLTNQGVHGYEDPPFLDVAHTSIEAYNLSSLYVCALQKNAQPTIVGVNVNPAMVKTEITNSDGTKGTKEIPIPLTLGGALWFKSPPGGTASQSSVNMLETSGAGLAETRAAYEMSLNSMYRQSLNGVLENAGAEIGESSIEIPVSYDGTDVTVKLDPKFVIEFAKSLPADKLVTVRLDAAGERPVLFTTDDSCRYVVMPMA